MKPASLVCGGVFQPDPTLPADHRGRQTCVCGLLGKALDAHHTPADPGGQDAQKRAAGEREEAT